MGKIVAKVTSQQATVFARVVTLASQVFPMRD